MRFGYNRRIAIGYWPHLYSDCVCMTIPVLLHSYDRIYGPRDRPAMGKVAKSHFWAAGKCARRVAESGAIFSNAAPSTF